MRILKWLLIAVLALLALNAFAYGAFFAFSPAGGLQEFGHDGLRPVMDSDIFLVSMVGIGLLGFMGFAVLAIVLILQGRRSGLFISLWLGLVYIAMGAWTLLHQLRVDALIYGGFGILILVMGIPLLTSLGRPVKKAPPSGPG